MPMRIKQIVVPNKNSNAEISELAQIEQGQDEIVDFSPGNAVVAAVDTEGPGDEPKSLAIEDLPPDGGFEAWWQVFMTHIVIFNTWGYINSFGLFQTYYETTLDESASAISWIGSVQIFLLFFMGTASGRAADAGYFKSVFAVGLFLQLLGTFMTSLCTTYLQLLLAQGICTGLGNGLMFCPSLSVLSTYFSTKRAQAIGIAASGTATGGIVFPIVAQKLLPNIGFGWTVRVMGFIMLGTMCLPLAFSRSRLSPRRSGPFIEWRAFKEVPFTLYTAGLTLCFWGLYFAYYYIGSYGVSALQLSNSDSINLLLILNAGGVPGRLLPNVVADRWLGPINTMIPLAASSALLIYTWISVGSQGGLITFAAIYGVVAAGMLSLFPAALASLNSHPRNIGARLGMVMSCLSIACLIGPPIGGALISAGNGDYIYSQCFFGTIVALGSMFLVCTRVYLTGWTFKQRV